MNSTEKTYYPMPESKVGWRYLKEPEEVRTIAGMNPEKLKVAMEKQLHMYAGHQWTVAIIRHGYLVGEYYTFGSTSTVRYNICSATKSFTGTAWGLLLDDSLKGKLPGGKKVDLETYVYDYIPEGYPLTDPRKKDIKVKHLLSMTSGLRGEDYGVWGINMTMDTGPFEHALGRCPNRLGRWVDELAAEPGTKWDYCDPGYAHLSLMFKNIMGREMSEYMKERVFDPIGLESISWTMLGGSGFMGPHTEPHTGIYITARELAKFGYLAMNKGNWEGKQIVPEWWMDIATKSSQDLNPDYGYTWWVNTKGTCWPYLPKDAFAQMGYNANKCYIIPSLDLVVARVGAGPSTFFESDLIGGIASTIVE